MSERDPSLVFDDWDTTLDIVQALKALGYDVDRVDAHNEPMRFRVRDADN